MVLEHGWHGYNRWKLIDTLPRELLGLDRSKQRLDNDSSARFCQNFRELQSPEYLKTMGKCLEN